MTQHTQGEWIVSDARMAPGGIVGRYIAHKDGGMIAEAFSNCLVNDAEELEANARLIAAAPELLKESQGLRMAFRMILSATEIEQDETFITVSAGDNELAKVSVGDIVRRLDAAITKATGGAA